ncbi:hypothetical protein MARSALSMR5_01884 [Marinobacter salarius]|uniref:Uncharacterized protein n=1 Tax=Marinobacter salarius TaxID=1420917 RepID=A0A1W6K9G2_9GAMM|nr:hypothetical protein MARSALSMR5_01884 [Marinobacter salarius]
MGAEMVIIYVSIVTLALSSGLAGFALTTRRFGEAFVFVYASTACAVSIVQAASL